MTNPSPWQEFCDAIESAWPVSRYRDVGVVVGCSGGADSVALLRCLAEATRPRAGTTPPSGFIVVAHFNHRFRGEASDGDADFVRRLADQFGLAVEIECGDAAARDEESARNHRRAFFRNLLGRYGARYLALGHSRDDNVETVLYRMMRGTGPLGMAGVAPFRPFSEHPSDSDFVIARPMLSLGRDQIRGALRSIDAAWREDASNQSNTYRRNWIRNELLPAMETQFPHAVTAIARAVEGQRQWKDALQSVIDRWIEDQQVREAPLTLRRLDRIGGGGMPGRDWEQDSGAASPAEQAVAIEALRRCWHRAGWPLRDMGQHHWTRVVEMLYGGGPDALTLPGAVDVRRDQEAVVFVRRDPVFP
ncbi:tRNA(Ile)-lysidine synthase [Stieleria maiorica]|uniref:tRNA(Ile)-lysidine synthase n=1 Tax=Stieleria maiorica TaxID=2795974 RepID=A0A5B9MBQ5_9BACT|nr:tRNA lysidine(34) synthetase TilS [Stieleria maiorica]QEF96975.1 tRNA(Ile)-lysidine synthase [Stieleria maiorica]